MACTRENHVEVQNYSFKDWYLSTLCPLEFIWIYASGKNFECGHQQVFTNTTNYLFLVSFWWRENIRAKIIFSEKNFKKTEIPQRFHPIRGETKGNWPIQKVSIWIRRGHKVKKYGKLFDISDFIEITQYFQKVMILTNFM